MSKIENNSSFYEGRYIQLFDQKTRNKDKVSTSSTQKFTFSEFSSQSPQKQNKKQNFEIKQLSITEQLNNMAGMHTRIMEMMNTQQSNKLEQNQKQKRINGLNIFNPERYLTEPPPPFKINPDFPSSTKIEQEPHWYSNNVINQNKNINIRETDNIKVNESTKYLSSIPQPQPKILSLEELHKAQELKYMSNPIRKFDSVKSIQNRIQPNHIPPRYIQKIIHQRKQQPFIQRFSNTREDIRNTPRNGSIQRFSFEQQHKTQFDFRPSSQYIRAQPKAYPQIIYNFPSFSSTVQTPRNIPTQNSINSQPFEIFKPFSPQSPVNRPHIPRVPRKLNQIQKSLNNTCTKPFIRPSSISRQRKQLLSTTYTETKNPPIILNRSTQKKYQRRPSSGGINVTLLKK